jgi:ATP synthase F1 delta subunit
MIGSEAVLAKKYAQAFFNVYGSQLTEDDFHNACAAGAFFEQHQKALFFLKQPVIETSIKVNTIKHALSVFHLKNQFDKLIALLATHKRLFLIMLVLEKLCELYKKYNNIMTFTISSSHKLEAAQLDILKQFLVNITGQTIVYEYMVDKKLIAGIRMESPTLLWEHSISKQLASIKLPNMY